MKALANMKNGKWLAGLVLGIASTLAIAMIYHATHPPISSAQVRLAKLEGRDAYEMDELQKMATQAEKSRTLSDQDWDRVMHFYHRQNDHDKMDAMSVLQMIDAPGRRDSLLAIARENLESPNEFIQAKALRQLWICHAPEWQEEMTKRKTSDNETIRTAAETCLRKGEFSRKNKKP